MPAKPARPRNIDQYIANSAPHVRAVLREIRAAIREAAPEAEEVISYQMPAFRQEGMLVYFAAWKEHVGLYPPVRGDAALERAVSRFAGPNGNLQFPLDRPMPLGLIRRIVKLRLKQNLAKKAQKKRPAKR